MSTIQERLCRLEDLEDIRDLTARYADATNRGYSGKTIDWETLHSIYTADARWTSRFMGLDVTGADAITESLRAQEGGVDAALHSFVNPVIDLHGDEADARWSMLIGSVHGGAERSIFLAATFGYRRTDDGWRVSSVNVDYAAALVVASRRTEAEEER